MLQKWMLFGGKIEEVPIPSGLGGGKLTGVALGVVIYGVPLLLAALTARWRMRLLASAGKAKRA